MKKSVLPKLFDRVASKWEIWLIPLIWVGCSLIVMIQNKVFISGDTGTIGLIVDDMNKGHFYSWYFYGQDYYGNLEPFLFSLVTKFTGNSIQILYFLEYVWMYLSVVVGLFTIQRLRTWQVGVFSFIFFFAHRNYELSFQPQGWTLLLFITVYFYSLFKKLSQNEQKFSWWIFFLVGFFTTLSIWHNVIYIIILPLFLVIYTQNILKKTLEWKYWHLAWFVLGVGLGIIPLVLATLTTAGGSLAYFSNNTTHDFISSFGYLAQDYTRFFLRYYATPIQLDNSYGLVLACLFAGLFGIGMWKYRKLPLVWFIVAEFCLLLSKNYIHKDGTSTAQFEYVRYAFIFYFLAFLIVFQVCVEWLELGSSRVQKTISILTLILLVVFGTNIYLSKLLAKPNDYAYNQIFNDLIHKYDVHTIKCEGYFEVCNTMAYLGRNGELQAEVYQSGNPWVIRNPRGQGAVQTALHKGEKVMSVEIMQSDRQYERCYTQLDLGHVYCVRYIYL